MFESNRLFKYLFEIYRHCLVTGIAVPAEFGMSEVTVLLGCAQAQP